MSLKPRERVYEFAQLMESKLQNNDHKGGWKLDEYSDLLRKLKNEVEELEMALINRDGAVNEAVDVANYAMMIADNLRYNNP